MFGRYLFFFIIFLFLVSSVFANGDKPKIVVIGGGLSGLTTALCLHQGGMDVEVYEARHRVGGRVLSVYISGQAAEMGGQNITDGGSGENMLRLVNEFGLELSHSNIPLRFTYFDGNALTPVEKSTVEPKELRVLLDELKTSCRNMEEVLDVLFDRENYYYQCLATRLAGYEGGTIDQLSTDYIETLYYMISGGLSTVHQEEYVHLVSIKGGNSLLPEKMAESLGPRVHLGMPLTKVSEDGNGAYLLTFENGHQVEADILILAIPCSIYETIAFKCNDLGKERLNTIQNLRFGTNAKILVPTESMPSIPQALIHDKMISFFVDKSLLTMYCTGDSSQFFEEMIACRITKMSPVFDKFFGNVGISNQPGVYAKDETFVHYDSAVGYSWPNDPYARGSYSFVGAGQEDNFKPTVEESGESFRALFAPIKQKLYFVGEHTTLSLEIIGTMEAACESGARCARAILREQP